GRDAGASGPGDLRPRGRRARGPPARPRRLKRGRTALSSSAKSPQTTTTTRAPRQPIRRCLTDDGRPRYPATAITSPTEHAGAPEEGPDDSSRDLRDDRTDARL